MSYELRIVRSAEREISRFPSAVRTRLSKRIISLEESPRPRGARKLTGREEYRLRVGDYRILYIIDDRNQIVTILAAGHRQEVYG